MGQLAILGHATRGKEVIEILEMLGGKNIYKYRGDRKDLVYFINSDYYGSIDNDTESNIHSYKLYSFEEFLEKFPYKVGDKVYYNNRICSIIEMRWNGNLNIVRYGVDDGKIKNLALAEELKPYKKVESFEILEEHCADEVKIEFDPFKFEMVERENGYYVVRKKPKYPKTYEECCNVIGIDVSRTIKHDDCPFYEDVTRYEHTLLSSLVYLRKLIICRDAYWKIAGEQMGFGKSWKPDYIEGVVNTYYTIHLFNNKLFCAGTSHRNAILSFPTEEMRNIFYENFKELIELCKELL